MRTLEEGEASRRIRAVVIAAVLGFASFARAEEASVPVPLQATLLVKVANYDRNMAARAGDRVQVLVVTKGGKGESTLAATQLQKALLEEKTIAGKPHACEIIDFGGAPELAKEVQARNAAIVYVTPGFSEQEVAAIAQSLAPVSVLSVGAVASYVPKGMVLGMDLVSGKPKLVVNLTQARKQSVNFDASLLKLTKVIE
jgi:hypothetical protein